MLNCEVCCSADGIIAERNHYGQTVLGRCRACLDAYTDENRYLSGSSLMIMKTLEQVESEDGDEWFISQGEL